MHRQPQSERLRNQHLRVADCSYKVHNMLIFAVRKRKLVIPYRGLDDIFGASVTQIARFRQNHV